MFYLGVVSKYFFSVTLGWHDSSQQFDSCRVYICAVNAPTRVCGLQLCLITKGYVH